ncbi:hypothetical protein [Spiroplasma endosymbiont of Crioceris asparagi]|uniref:hypothetical protein n=1 Tax=Spiroplasma endosymbiont of Crioceris asparagi TaxID=3066286 RepID=UPI0030D24A4A
MFKNQKKLLKILKWNILLNKKMIIFFTILFTLILLFMTIILFLASQSSPLLKKPTMAAWYCIRIIFENNKDHHSISSVSGNAMSFGELSYFFFSIAGFILLSSSSIYFVNKLFLSELKGKISIWLMSGVSKNGLLIIKLLTIQIINLTIVFLSMLCYYFCFKRRT